MNQIVEFPVAKWRVEVSGDGGRAKILTFTAYSSAGTVLRTITEVQSEGTFELPSALPYILSDD